MQGLLLQFNQKLLTQKTTLWLQGKGSEGPEACKNLRRPTQCPLRRLSKGFFICSFMIPKENNASYFIMNLKPLNCFIAWSRSGRPSVQDNGQSQLTPSQQIATFQQQRYINASFIWDRRPRITFPRHCPSVFEQCQRLFYERYKANPASLPKIGILLFLYLDDVLILADSLISGKERSAEGSTTPKEAGCHAEPLEVPVWTQSGFYTLIWPSTQGAWPYPCPKTKCKP